MAGERRERGVVAEGFLGGSKRCGGAAHAVRGLYGRKGRREQKQLRASGPNGFGCEAAAPFCLFAGEHSLLPAPVLMWAWRSFIYARPSAVLCSFHRVPKPPHAIRPLTQISTPRILILLN